MNASLAAINSKEDGLQHSRALRGTAKQGARWSLRAANLEPHEFIRGSSQQWTLTTRQLKGNANYV